jgi:PIN domain nuclease of toxin-antitoxin system
MRVLLDTHVFVWSVMDHPKLDQRARELIASADEIYISAVSLWEIAIKSGLGKIEANADELVSAIGESGFLALSITPEHAARVGGLPVVNSHKDPFDRMLVAQALTEPLVLLTADEKLVAYGEIVRVI